MLKKAVEDQKLTEEVPKAETNQNENEEKTTE